MPQQHGSCIIASVRAGGTGRISTRAHPSAMARPVTSRHHGAYAIFHPLAIEWGFGKSGELFI
eukprot:607757-Prymnesium_polylepis.1